MNIRRIDHVGIIVNDLAAARDFFVDFGLVVHGEAGMEGDLLDTSPRVGRREDILRHDGAARRARPTSS